MVKIRLQRRGRKKLPMYKIVAADSRSPRDGRFIEAIGQYKPLENPPMIEINEDRAMYWLKVGAQPSDTVRSLLSKQGVMLKLHLTRKGKSEEEIAAELEKWSQERAAKAVNKLSRKQRRAEAKKQEEAKAAEEAVKETEVQAEAAPVEAAAPAEEEAPVETSAEKTENQEG